MRRCGRSGGTARCAVDATGRRMDGDDLAAAFRAAGLDAAAVDDIAPLLWRKLIVNAAINPLGALAGRAERRDRRRSGPCRRSPACWRREAAAVAAADGCRRSPIRGRSVEAAARRYGGEPQLDAARSGRRPPDRDRCDLGRDRPPRARARRRRSAHRDGAAPRSRARAGAMKRRVGAAEIAARKGAAFPVVTAYDAPFARCAEAAGIDVILVGDSLGMVVLGYASTIAGRAGRHGAARRGAAARGTERAHVIVDLPFGSYEASDALAVASAVALVKRGGASSVKLEGGEPPRRAFARSSTPASRSARTSACCRRRPRSAAASASSASANGCSRDARRGRRGGRVRRRARDGRRRARRGDHRARSRSRRSGSAAARAATARCWCCTTCSGCIPTRRRSRSSSASLGDAATAALRAYADEVRAGTFPPERARPHAELGGYRPN